MGPLTQGNPTGRMMWPEQPGWLDGTPMDVGKCPKCGRAKLNPHPLDRCSGGPRVNHRTVPLQVVRMSLQPCDPEPVRETNE